MIVRKIEDVDVIDVGKANGMPEGLVTVQWIVSNKVGDESYRHQFAVRKYTLKPLPPEIVPFHNHKYVQCMTLIKGKLWVESPDASGVFPGKRAPQGRSHRRRNRRTLLHHRLPGRRGELLARSDCQDRRLRDQLMVHRPGLVFLMSGIQDGTRAG